MKEKENMEEFIKLFFTGKRAENLARFRRTMTAFGIVGIILAALPAVLSYLSLTEFNLVFGILSSVFGILFGIAGVALRQYQTAYIRGLAELQNAANETELRGEEREVHLKMYAAWTETLGKRSKTGILSAILTLLGYSLIITVGFLFAFVSVPDVVFMVSCILFGLLLIAPTILDVTAEGRARTAFYERAEREIEEVKRKKLGLSEKKIASESENARAYSAVPLSVRMFLKEETERSDFQDIAKWSGVLSLLLGFIIGAALVIFPFTGMEDTLGPALTWTLAGAFGVLVVTIFFAAIYPLERRKKEIYRRNDMKLGKGEADGLRRDLQMAWTGLQRSGNIMFLVAFALPFVLGTALGLFGYFTVEGVVLAESIGSSIMLLLIPAALISLVIWMIMFACYRRKVRPIEAQLKKKLREEGR